MRKCPDPPPARPLGRCAVCARTVMSDAAHLRQGSTVKHYACADVRDRLGLDRTTPPLSRKPPPPVDPPLSDQPEQVRLMRSRRR